jgi:hypothetical protein
MLISTSRSTTGSPPGRNWKHSVAVPFVLPQSILWAQITHSICAHFFKSKKHSEEPFGLGFQKEVL